MDITVKTRLTTDAKLPAYAHPGDAGMDLFSNEEATLAPMERALVPTGVFLEIPEGFEGQVRPKSGLAIKQGLTCLNTPGTIDAGYRGEVKVILINLGKEEVILLKGSKIAQLVFSKVDYAQLDVTDNLSDSKRGEGGFGSTGER
ncbi:MAG: dUTP diphosphatase [archaeon]